MNEKNVRKSIRCEFISLSNIYNGDFCNNDKRLKVTIFAKSSSIDIWQGTEWAPENRCSDDRCSDNNDNEIGHEYCLFYQTSFLLLTSLLILSFQREQMRDLVLKAIHKDKSDFVELFLEIGVNILWFCFELDRFYSEVIYFLFE